MSFAGNAAPAGGLLSTAVYVPPTPYTQAIYYNDDLSYKGVQGFSTDSPVEAGFRLRTLVVSITDQPLRAYVGPSVDGSEADTGILTTAATGPNTPNEHGLPANFGPGRDNWTIGDLHRLTFQIMEQQISAPVLGDGAVVPAGVSIEGGNLRLIFKNTSPNPIDVLSAQLQYNPN